LVVVVVVPITAVLVAASLAAKLWLVGSRVTKGVGTV